ncbi:hypothetical protein R6242_18815 [Iodobacter sp. CM08]|uniref:hypothetical protein n=1 Tax=Iodobacter sp. CM08 TaxID=3085902 RepID=UPI002981D28E|nr:hypothetical protein [Iodobacter sp. CM08]MDW5418621.1 hypothetical protein [Iodobacter sp. CM08]
MISHYIELLKMPEEQVILALYTTYSRGKVAELDEIAWLSSEQQSNKIDQLTRLN